MTETNAPPMQMKDRTTSGNRPLTTDHRPLLVVRWCKALAAFGAAALENETATLRAHAHAEAVRLGAAAVIGLKSSSHTYTSR